MPQQSVTFNTPRRVDCLLHCRWIIPVVPADTVLRDCSIAIDDGRIIAIVPSDEVAQKFQAQSEQQLDRHLVIPGLINAHNHAAMTLLRGLADDLPLKPWLEEHIWPAENRWVSAEFVADGTRQAIAEMLRSGTTTFSDMYFFPEQAADAALHAGMRCVLHFPIFDFPCAWGSGADDYIHKGLSLHDKYRSHPLIQVGFGPHAPYTVSDGPLQRVAMLAEELQAPIQIHLHETAHEVQEAIAKDGRRPLERLHQLGFLSPLVQCVHMTQIVDSDIQILSETGASVVHCPSSNLKLASGFCPTQKLLDAGVNVALGTDGAASNNTQDLLAEMNLAALLAKAVHGDATALSAHSALRMATLNGAKSLGLDALIGSLEVGKQADITAIAIGEIEHQPCYHPESLLAYGQLSHCVSDVWVNGHQLLRERQLTTIDTQRLRHSTRDWQQRLAPR